MGYEKQYKEREISEAPTLKEDHWDVVGGCHLEQAHTLMVKSRTSILEQ